MRFQPFPSLLSRFTQLKLGWASHTALEKAKAARIHLGSFSFLFVTCFFPSPCVCVHSSFFLTQPPLVFPSSGFTSIFFSLLLRILHLMILTSFIFYLLFGIFFLSFLHLATSFTIPFRFRLVLVRFFLSLSLFPVCFIFLTYFHALERTNFTSPTRSSFQLTHSI